MNGRNRFPFTPSQWQELEHQALIYKYMASGISIPPDLLFTIKRSYFDSPLCRRTDGKKWRCSKEAYPDSKYCERHMHRGKNRSRKPVEVLKAATTTTITNASTQQAISSITKSNNTLSPLASSETTQHQQHSCYGSSFLYHHPPSRSSGIGLSFEDNSAPLFLDTGSCSHSNTDCRYVYGEKEEVDEHAFFTEPCGIMKSFSASSMDESWQLTPLTMSSSSSSSKQRSSFGLSSDYSHLQLQSHSKQQEQQDRGCYMLGGQLVKEEPQKTVHRFFDEWPHKGRGGSWLDLDDKSSTTQLSISIPTSSHDFPTFSSRTHHVFKK
ncbi:Growth-regulating factor 3, partial [Mucuna pruriens]